MKLIKGKSTGVTALKNTVRKTPMKLWSAGKRTSRNLNALNPKEDIEQEEKKKKRRGKRTDITRFMTPSELRKWEKLPERKKEQILRKARLTEEERTNPAIFKENYGSTGFRAAYSRSASRNGQRYGGTSGWGSTFGSGSAEYAGGEKNTGKYLTTVNRNHGISRINKAGADGETVSASTENFVTVSAKASRSGGKAAETAGRTVSSAGKTAASAGKTAASSAATVGSAAATAGTSLAADAAKSASKKIAKKFREKLQMEAAQKAESLRLTQEDQKKREDDLANEQTKGKGDSGTDSNGLSTTVRKVIAALVAIVSAFMSAIAAILFYVLLVVFIFVTIIVILVSFFTKTGGTGRQSMVEAALAEYAESDQNIGGVKYKNWYGLDDNWCGMFVAYCADQCGYISSGIIVKSASVSESKAWYEARDEFQTKESGYIPMPGDIIYFTNGMSHMGIVIEYDESTDHVIVIDGNSGPSSTEIYHKGSRVCRHEYARTMAAISGYATPAYPDRVSDLEGGTNAEKIFNGLVAQGYSEAAASAVVGNLYREAGVDAAGDIKLHSENADGSSIGIAQWTGGRKEAFLAFAEAAGEPWPDTGLEVQLKYMLMELSSNQWMWTSIGSEYGEQCAMSLAEFKGLDDPEFATRVFCAMYERCHIQNAALPYRTRKALETYNAFGHK